jgi:hypothetical protein
MKYYTIGALLEDVYSIIKNKKNSLILLLIPYILIPILLDVFFSSVLLGHEVSNKIFSYLAGSAIPSDLVLDPKMLFRFIVIISIEILAVISLDSLVVIALVYIILSKGDDTIKSDAFLQICKETFKSVFKVISVTYVITFVWTTLNIAIQTNSNSIGQVLRFILVNLIVIYTTLTLFVPFCAVIDCSSIKQAFVKSFYTVRHNVHLSFKIVCIYLMILFVMKINIFLLVIATPIMKILLGICAVLIYSEAVSKNLSIMQDEKI